MSGSCRAGSGLWAEVAIGKSIPCRERSFRHPTSQSRDVGHPEGRVSQMWATRQEVLSGSHLIKIGTTRDCPYIRLSQLRNALPKKSYIRSELLGIIAIPDSQGGGNQQGKRMLQKKFEDLHEEGDWFRPGIALVDHIRAHAQPHFCTHSCPRGSSMEEERCAFQEMISLAVAKAR